VCISLLPSAFGWWVRFLDDLLAGSLSGAIAGSVHYNLVAVVSEAIERALGENRIIEERGPLFDRAVGRHDRRGAPVALDDDFVEVAGLLRIQAAEAEVIDNQEIGRQQAS